MSGDHPSGSVPIMDGISLEHTPDHVHVAMRPSYRVLSSAVFNGGLLDADHVLNLAVPLELENEAEEPEASLRRYCERHGWHGTCVGMMTAASMDSLRLVQVEEQGVHVAVLVTCGLSNTRRAGDPAEHRVMFERGSEVGTINTIVMTSARLTPAAMAETIMIATEAKTAALHGAGALSAVSGEIATGTGTDAVAVVCGPGPETVRWAGKHVLFGEIVGASVLAAVTSSMVPGEPLVTLSPHAMVAMSTAPQGVGEPAAVSTGRPGAAG